MALSKNDMQALLALRYPNSQEVVLANSQWEDLEESGFVDKKHKLTKQGKEKADAISAMLDQLRRGVPLHRRKTAAPEKLQMEYTTDRDSLHPWVTSSVGGHLFTTNKELLIFGPPDPWMASNKQKGLGEKVIPILKEMGQRIYRPVVAAFFQTDGKIDSKLSCVWVVSAITDTGPRIRMAIQSKYYDYLMKRFPTSSIFACEGELLNPVQFRVKNKGVSKLNIVALLMPMKVPETWVTPRGGSDAEEV